MFCCQCCLWFQSRPWSSRTASPWAASWPTRPGSVRSGSRSGAPWRSPSSSRTSRRSAQRWRSSSSPTSPRPPLQSSARWTGKELLSIFQDKDWKVKLSKWPECFPLNSEYQITSETYHPATQGLKTFLRNLKIFINFRNGIQERFKQTDQALEDVPTWPNVRKTCYLPWPRSLDNPGLRLINR